RGRAANRSHWFSPNGLALCDRRHCVHDRHCAALAFASVAGVIDSGKGTARRMSQGKCIAVAAIRSLIEDSLTVAGLPREDANVCARLMGEADLTGADAHGVFRLPQYVRRLKAGGFNKRPNITVTRLAPATALVDGDNGMGHLVMSRAAETA